MGRKFFLAAVAAGVAIAGAGLADEVALNDVEAAGAGDQQIIDDFDSGLPSGVSTDGESIGFSTFQAVGSVAISTESTPPAPIVPGTGSANDVMRLDVDVLAFGGYTHAFENPSLDTWVTDDWSGDAGVSLWFFGTNSGTALFLDILDNRNPGSTTDDAERYTVAFDDDFTGWQLLEFPFSSFVRKEIGNGAPNDGLGLVEVHGYQVGTLGTGGLRTFYIDDVRLVPEPSITFALAIGVASLACAQRRRGLEMDGLTRSTRAWIGETSCVFSTAAKYVSDN